MQRPDPVIVTEVPTGTQPTTALRTATERLLRELSDEQRPQPANLDALLTDPAARLVVAVVAANERPANWAVQDDRTFIGMLTLTFRNSLTRKSAFIDHVVVDARHRRRGIATTMLQHAVDLARAAGATRVDLTSSSARRAAAHLYPSRGFQQRDTVHWRRWL